MAEHLKIEVIGCARGPETKRVDGVAAITDYGPIKGNTDQARGLASDCAQAPAVHLEGAIQLDFNLVLGARNLPRVRETEPIVRLFLLPAITDGLLKHAVFVTQSVAHGRELHRRHRIEETSRQAPESAVT